jgi:DNA-binding CsgD family transcriptional regulator
MVERGDWTKPPNTPTKTRRLGAQPRPGVNIERPRLSQRQTEVLGLVSNGYSNGEIALQLGMAEETAKHHLKSIYRRLGARNRAHAVTRGFQLGLLSIGSQESSYVRSEESLYE